MGKDKSRQKKRGKAAPLTFLDDYNLVQLIIAGEEKGWMEFYGRYRMEIEKFIRNYSPGTFTDTDVDLICDKVQERIMANDFKALRLYEGRCPFSNYLAMQVRWTILDNINRYLSGGRQVSLNDQLEHEMQGSHEEGHGKSKKEDEGFAYEMAADPDGKVPEAIFRLEDNLRWAFLLRYYDYFEFPKSEIRLLARKRGVSIRELMNQKNDLLEGTTNRLLESRRKKQSELEDKIQELSGRIQDLQREHDRVEVELQEEETTPTKELTRKEKKFLKLRGELERKNEKRDRLIGELKEGYGVVKTPYEIIAKILEANEITVRTWVMKAKEQLQEFERRFKKKH